MAKSRHGEQLPLQPAQSKGWGGRRAGAGRPRKRDQGNPHRARPSLKPTIPLHITLRLVKGVESIREPKVWKGVERAMREGAGRFATREGHWAGVWARVEMVDGGGESLSWMAGLQKIEARDAQGLRG